MAKRAKAVTAEKKRGAPTKKCPKCGAENHARKAECVSCGYKFEIKSKRAAKKASLGQTAHESINGRRRRAKATSNGAIDVRAVLTVQALLKTMDASELKRIVDDVANTQVPF